MAIAAATGLMPPNLRRVLADAPAARGSFRDIKHVALVMIENRSFHHYFGTMASVRGFNDADALKLANGKSIFHQPDPEHPDGHLLPFHLDTYKTSAQKIPSTSHAWGVQHGSWNGGKMVKDMGDPVDAQQMNIRALADLRQAWTASFAYFEVFWSCAVLGVLLVFLVLMMKRF